MLAPLYPILDIDLLTARSLDVASIATAWRRRRSDAGAVPQQARQRAGDAARCRPDPRDISVQSEGARLIFNDRPDLALLAGFDGVHVGQRDVSAEDARRIVGATRWVGVSTNSAEQVMEADKTNCDYIAYGPIFPTASKINPDPTVGLAGLTGRTCPNR